MGKLLNIPTKEEMLQLSARERAVVVKQLAQAEREIAVGFADVMDAEERSGDYRDDGHRSVRSWYIAQTDDDAESAGEKTRLMKVLRTLPGARDALMDGDVTLAQARSLVWAHHNPRVREHLPFMETQLLAYAAVVDAVEFDGYVRELVGLADADGAAQRAEARHQDRRAHHSKVGDGFRGDYSCGAAQGVIIDKVLKTFEQREFDADCAEAKARVGDGYSVNDLTRTRQQRRLDSLVAVCQTAAAATPGLKFPEPLVNLRVDLRTMNEIIEEAATGVRTAPDFTDLHTRCCETTDGVQIPRSDMLAAALAGQVRRVVVDDRKVTIDMGRRRRLYQGNNRDAVMIRSTRCVWAGCDLPASECEADHLDPYAQGGGTNAESGAPKCGKHNRWSTRGFTTRLDADGRWRTHRPDGTSINDPPAA